MVTTEEDMQGYKEFQDSPSSQKHITSSSDEENENIESENIKFTLQQQLTTRDLKSISDNEMFNDTVMHVSQGMIQRQYPGMGGSSLGAKFSFSIYQSKPFLKILHNGNFYWIAVYSYECKPGEVYYMDSLF